MPRRKYKADEGYVALKKKSIKGKKILGGCLKAEGASDRAIEKIYLHSDEIDLAFVRYEKELYVYPTDVETWVNSSAGKRWAFPAQVARTI